MSTFTMHHAKALIMLNELIYTKRLDAAENIIKNFSQDLHDAVREKLVSFILRAVSEDPRTLSRLDRPEVTRSDWCDQSIEELVLMAKEKKPDIVTCCSVSVRKAVEEFLELLAESEEKDMLKELADLLVVLLTRSFPEDVTESVNKEYVSHDDRLGLVSFCPIRTRNTRMAVQRFRDGTLWITVLDSQGREASLNLSVLHTDTGPLVRKTFCQWAADVLKDVTGGE